MKNSASSVNQTPSPCLAVVMVVLLITRAQIGQRAVVSNVLSFYTGPMGSGKSTLFLQMAYNLGCVKSDFNLILLRVDPAWQETGIDIGVIDSRVGARTVGNVIGPRVNLSGLAGSMVLVDEAHFLTQNQVDTLFEASVIGGAEVMCFGLLADFSSKLFPGSARLVELADAIHSQGGSYCWCGQPGKFNARMDQSGQIVRIGQSIVVGDITDGPGSREGARYQVLCNAHYVAGQFG